MSSAARFERDGIRDWVRQPRRLTPQDWIDWLTAAGRFLLGLRKRQDDWLDVGFLCRVKDTYDPDAALAIVTDRA